MLKSFSVENFKSFDEKFTLNLGQAKEYVFNPECVANGIAKKVLIYGPNASGKSNLAKGIFDIVGHLTDKLKNLQFYDNYRNLDTDTLNTRFEFEFFINNHVVKYEYVKSDFVTIISEHLRIDGVEVLSREMQSGEQKLSINLGGTETLNRVALPAELSLLKYVANNTAVFTSESGKTFQAFMSFVNNMLMFFSLDRNYYQGYETTTRSITTEILERGKLDDFQEFLTAAGVGDHIGIGQDNNGKPDIVFEYKNSRLNFYANASRGTQALSLLYYWMLRLQEPSPPSLILIDEFDAFYHPALAEQIVKRLINNDSQIILITHDTHLLTNELMRPDCYFVMNRKRIDPLFALTDRELREAHNLEKLYLSGAFDAGN